MRRAKRHASSCYPERAGRLKSHAGLGCAGLSSVGLICSVDCLRWKDASQFPHVDEIHCEIRRLRMQTYCLGLVSLLGDLDLLDFCDKYVILRLCGAAALSESCII